MSTISLKKISVKTVVGAITAAMISALKVSGKNEPVMRVIGIATESKTGVTTFGVWTSLVGTFEAVNLITGEVFAAQNLLLPMGYCEQAALILQDEKVTQLPVAVDVYVKFHQFGTEEKYEYAIQAHQVESERIDPLASLRASLPVAQKPLALTAPAANAAPSGDAPKQADPAPSATAETSAPAETPAPATASKGKGK